MKDKVLKGQNGHDPGKKRNGDTGRVAPLVNLHLFNLSPTTIVIVVMGWTPKFHLIWQTKQSNKRKKSQQLLVTLITHQQHE